MLNTDRNRTALLRSLGIWLALWSAGGACAQDAEDAKTDGAPFVLVLGVAQDAGFPQAGCRRDCCRDAWANAHRRRFASSLAVVDPESRQRWVFDCTPDFRDQLRLLDQAAPADSTPGLDGVLLTHAHIGHYTGLVHLGREVLGARGVPVYAMPRMRRFLESNGPWDQLVKLNQIEIRKLAAATPTRLNARIRVTPFLVPHRDEYSETVGFQIQGPSRKAIYLPDIDKWDRWDVQIEDLLGQVDVAYLDGTFFADGEIPGRDISQIPHPFVTESIRRFKQLPAGERNKVRFIHANHTNPILDPSSSAADRVRKAGHRVAKQGERYEL